jgi:hypothetical protein
MIQDTLPRTELNNPHAATCPLSAALGRSESVPYPNHAAFHLTFRIRPYSSSIRVNRQFFYGNRPVKGPVHVHGQAVSR